MIKPRIIALDYGKVRIGAAKTDPLRNFVEPMGTFNESDLLKTLKNLNAECGIETFVVGYPLSYDGSQNEATHAVDDFILRLAEHFPYTNTIKQNEYGSTLQASDFLKQIGVSRPKRVKKGRLDAVVAARLLEAYLLKP